MKPSDYNNLFAASVSRRGFLGAVGTLTGMILVARYADVALTDDAR